MEICPKVNCGFHNTTLCPVCAECGSESTIIDQSCVNCWNCVHDEGYIRKGSIKIKEVQTIVEVIHA